MKIYLIILLLGFVKIGFNQNLVANPRFEDRNICTEFNAKCGPKAWFMASNSVPIGRNIAGITMFNSSRRNVRQYLQTELLMPLQKDSIYEIKLTILAGDCLLREIGVKFSSDVICLDKQELIEGADIDFSVQMKKFSKRNQKQDVKLIYKYKARGDERFVLLGSFVSDKNQIRQFTTKETQYQNYLYFIKNIEVNATFLDSLPQSCENVKQHLYNFNYRHTDCMYQAYQNPIYIDDNKEENIYKPVKIDSLVLGDVLFDFNSSVLNLETKSILQKSIQNIERNKVITIQIYGYTDNVGSDKYNIELSLKRANSIKDYLIELGYKPDIIQSYGKGKLNPIASNLTEEGRQQNRRILIVFEYN